MKTKIMTIALILILPCVINAQTTENLFNKYSGQTGIDAITISAEMIKVAGSSINITNNPSFPKGIGFSKVKGLKVLNLNEKTDKYDSFVKDSENILKSVDKEVLMDIKSSDGESVGIYGIKSSRKKEISEFILFRKNGSEATLVSVQGDFSLDDLNEIGKNINPK